MGGEFAPVMDSAINGLKMVRGGVGGGGVVYVRHGRRNVWT